MRWQPYVVGTRMSVDVRTEGALARAKELIEMRGPVAAREEKDHLEFHTRVLGFFFYGPFAWVTRTVVRTEERNGKTRLIYELMHPLDPWVLSAVLILILILAERHVLSSWLTLALLLASPLHSGILYFMHREIIRRIAGDPDRGEKLVRAARVR